MSDQRWYVGLCPHGVMVAAAAPGDVKDTTAFRAKLLRRGLSIGRVSTEELRDKLKRCEKCRPRRKKA